MELVSTPRNPMPAGAHVFEITTRDGARLRAVCWSATPGDKGTVLLLQGRSEFIEKYFEVIAELRRRGFGVLAFDWRGQGGSQRLLGHPRKGHVRRFDDYRDDLRAVLEQAGTAQGGPIFALAHSMGAAVLLRALADNPTLVARAVLTAPMIEIDRAAAPRWAAPLAHLLTLVGFGRAFVPGGGATAVTTRPFARNLASRDRARYERNADVIAAAPTLGLGDPTIGWLREAFAAMAPFADPNMPLGIRTPLLCIAGSADKITSTPAMERFAARLKAGRALVLPGAQHEILMERDEIRALFWAAFDAFIPGSESPEREPT